MLRTILAAALLFGSVVAFSAASHPRLAQNPMPTCDPSDPKCKPTPTNPDPVPTSPGR